MTTCHWQGVYAAENQAPVKHWPIIGSNFRNWFVGVDTGSVEHKQGEIVLCVSPWNTGHECVCNTGASSPQHIRCSTYTLLPYFVEFKDKEHICSPHKDMKGQPCSAGAVHVGTKCFVVIDNSQPMQASWLLSESRIEMHDTCLVRTSGAAPAWVTVMNAYTP